MKILRKSDRFNLKIGDVSFELAPLTFGQKLEISNESNMSKGDIVGTSAMAAKAIKFSVKGVSGITDLEDNEYELSFDENGNLTDECVDDLLNIEITSQLITSCLNLLNGIPKEIVDPVTGKTMKGVEITYKTKKK